MSAALLLGGLLLIVLPQWRARRSGPSHSNYGILCAVGTWLALWAGGIMVVTGLLIQVATI